MSDASGKAGKDTPPGETNLHRADVRADAGVEGRTAAAEQSPRRLTTHQKLVLIQVLLAFPDETVSVRYSTAASDALDYAEDFSTIFSAINWTVLPAAPADDLPRSASGLAIVVGKGTLPASAAALRDALRIYGIETEVTTDRSNVCGLSNFALAVTKP